MASLGFTLAIPALGILALAGLPRLSANRQGGLLAQGLAILCLVTSGLSLASLAVSFAGGAGKLGAHNWTIVPGFAGRQASAQHHMQLILDAVESSPGFPGRRPAAVTVQGMLHLPESNSFLIYSRDHNVFVPLPLTARH